MLDVRRGEKCKVKKWTEMRESQTQHIKSVMPKTKSLNRKYRK